MNVFRRLWSMSLLPRLGVTIAGIAMAFVTFAMMIADVEPSGIWKANYDAFRIIANITAYLVFDWWYGFLKPSVTAYAGEGFELPHWYSDLVVLWVLSTQGIMQGFDFVLKRVPPALGRILGILLLVIAPLALLRLLTSRSLAGALTWAMILAGLFGGWWMLEQSNPGWLF